MSERFGMENKKQKVATITAAAAGTLARLKRAINTTGIANFDVIRSHNNRQTKSAVEKAQFQYNSSLLNLQDKQKGLYTEIETLWLDALNAQQQYAAAEVKLKSSQTSFDMVNEQFRLGMKNTVELLTEKNNLLSAQQQRVQAKYMAILNRTLLDFYAGKDIEL